MSRVASDAVDNQEAIARRFAAQTGVAAPPTVPRWRSITPHRLYGLAARCLASSNAVEDRPAHLRDGHFAEPHTSRHAGWKP